MDQYTLMQLCDKFGAFITSSMTPQNSSQIRCIINDATDFVQMSHTILR